MLYAVYKFDAKPIRGDSKPTVLLETDSLDDVEKAFADQTDKGTYRMVSFALFGGGTLKERTVV